MKALLINLDKSVARLDFMRRQLASLNIAFERVAAVGVDDITPKMYEKRGFSWERPLRKAELACFLSHVKAWEMVAQGVEPRLILEDDALLHDKTAELIKSLILLDFDHVSLETRARKKMLGAAKKVGQHFELRRLYQDRTGAAAYVLSPKGAATLLSECEHRAAALADAFICASYRLKAWQVVPAAAIQLDRCAHYGLPFANPFESTITPSGSARPDVDNKAVFRRRRAFGQLRMGVRQLRGLLCGAKRLEVGIKTEAFRLPE